MSIIKDIRAFNKYRKIKKRISKDMDTYYELARTDIYSYHIYVTKCIALNRLFFKFFGKEPKLLLVYAHLQALRIVILTQIAIKNEFYRQSN